MKVSRLMRIVAVLLVSLLSVGLETPLMAAGFAEARIYIEYNDSDNDLGFHVSLDGEDWKMLKILNPAGTCIFAVEGKEGYRDLGLTELFFEGAEPTLTEFPLEDLLALFPEGRYRFIGTTVDGARLSSTSMLTHAIPDGPLVSADVDDDTVIIRWDPVEVPPPGFPSRRIDLVAFQVIVGSFQVTLPASSREVALPEEFVESLSDGEHDFEVLAIEAGGNQTISSGSFELD